MTYDGYHKYDATVARTYDSDRVGEPHWGAEFTFAANYAREHALGRLLDLPVGTGRLLPAVIGAEEIIGGDISADMLAQAQQLVTDNAWSNVHLQHMDALAIQFPDRHFNVCLCFRLIHLLPARLVPQLLAELGRVTGGTLLLQAYVATGRPLSWHVRAARAARSLLQRLSRSSSQAARPWSHIQAYSHSAEFIEANLRSAGFSSISRHGIADYEGSTVEVFEARR